MLPLGDHSSHWANFLGEIMREFLMHFGSRRSIPLERKAGVLIKIRECIDNILGCRSTMDNQSSVEEYIRLRTPMTRLTTWKLSDPDIPRTSLRKIRMSKSGFGLIPGSYRSRMLRTLKSDPPNPKGLFDTHTVGGVFLRDEDQRLYEEMLRLQGLGT
ncbi:hypothetical protein Tco_0672326 [Tanacetum coccineum]